MNNCVETSVLQPMHFQLQAHAPPRNDQTITTTSTTNSHSHPPARPRSRRHRFFLHVCLVVAGWSPFWASLLVPVWGFSARHRTRALQVEQHLMGS